MQRTDLRRMSLLIVLTAGLAAGRAQSQDVSTRHPASFDPRSVQLYAVGGGLVPFAPAGSVGSLDMSTPPGQQAIQAGGTSAATPLLGARIHVPFLWNMQDEGRRLAFGVFFETGIQSGFAAQSFVQTFQNTSGTASDYGSSTIQEYYQFPFLLGVTVPLSDGARGSGPLLDLYGGVTLDSWAQVLQGAEANAPGPGFFGQNRRFSADPTVGLGLRIPLADAFEATPLVFGINAEWQFRPGSVVTATSPNFPVTYSGTVDPYVNMAIMARIGIAFGNGR